MKTAERHQLKTNEVAQQLAAASDWMSLHGKQTVIAVVGGLALLAILVGVMAWRSNSRERAGAALAEAVTISQAEIIEAGDLPKPGTFNTEEARTEAAVKKLREVADQYPKTDAGNAARFRAATLLITYGKPGEAEQLFRDVIANDSGVHARMARMALAELQVQGGKYDDAITTYRELTAGADSDLPMDALLMQLGRAYELAGKRAEAMQAYQRVVDEFPDSAYVGDARKAADGLKAPAAS
ncbi:MAG: tetratricopeptide repeat protein [Vicinamibacterales bacterium]